MSRRATKLGGVGVLVAAGLALSACGSVSMSTAMTKWVSESAFVANTKTIVGDINHSARALKNQGESGAALHTVCGVLYYDTESANASLPTPDVQATTLLSRAYTLIGDAANECYVAAGDPARHVAAIGYLTKALADLSEGSARVVSDETP